MVDRPAFIELPVAGGGTINAVVATRDGIAEVDINGVTHIGLLMSVNTASATVSIYTPAEAQRIASQLSLIALKLAKTQAGRAPPQRAPRDVTQVTELTQLRWDDIGQDLWEIVDEQDQMVERVVEANTEEGWIIQEQEDEDGNPMIENESIVRIKVRGQFRIRRRRIDGVR